MNVWQRQNIAKLNKKTNKTQNKTKTETASYFRERKKR